MKQGPHQSHACPLGATCLDGGVNFCVFSRTAEQVDILFFDREDDGKPSRAVHFDPVRDRTYHYWHHFEPGIACGQIYAYRVFGPYEPSAGLWFDPSKPLLDPYGRGVVVPRNYDRSLAAARGVDNSPVAMKSVVVDPNQYDWEDDAPPRHPAARTIVYEMHVRGFTAHPNSGIAERKRGTYAGLIEKIPYLQKLGITAVELLPVFQFDAQDCPPGKVNYWGYQPVSFFAPHEPYSMRPDALGAVDEFRDMVKALHRAGIEVILDVVFNHTAEGGVGGPTLGFRGIDNPTYYILEDDRARYANFSGCGNTLNANNPIVRRMIVDSLRYWVEHMHVDGFRFDLASILSRDSSGRVLPNPPVLWDVETDPMLAGTKLIAEAWDAAGLYQVGSFVGDAWREWNGKFRDDARAFFRGDPGSLRRFADRLVGSPELFGHEHREPEQSINFVTCHDGFTINDLVSYDRKHNEANGEDNRDGCNDNLSWNHGIEGPTDDEEIERLRNRQVKNLLAATLLSIGMPMILMGDEVRRSQRGNNNAYCHDSDLAWFDWSLVEKHADVLRFVSLLIERRLLRGIEHEERRMSLNEVIARAGKSWHGVKLHQPDWSEHSHALAFNVELAGEGRLVHLMFNAWREPLHFELPQEHRGQRLLWRRWIDTALPSPLDIVDWTAAARLEGHAYPTQAHSMAVLFAELGTHPPARSVGHGEPGPIKAQ